MLRSTVGKIRGIGHGWRTGESVFSWADGGEWRSRVREDENIDARKFRIGFEPLFVDFNKKGAIYMVFLMFKWFVFGMVAGESRHICMVSLSASEYVNCKRVCFSTPGH